MNLVEKIKAEREAARTRREARRNRMQLNRDVRTYLDRIAADIWGDSGDIGEATRITEIKVRHDAQAMGLDPSTIVMIVQLAILIFKALKQLNVLSPTPELVSALFESEDE